MIKKSKTIILHDKTIIYGKFAARAHLLRIISLPRNSVDLIICMMNYIISRYIQWVKKASVKLS